MRSDPLTAWDDPGDVDGCAYIVTNGHDAPCGEPILLGSSYCALHHGFCHLRRGSRGEEKQLEVIKFLGAREVCRLTSAPTDEELDRLEAAAFHVK